MSLRRLVVAACLAALVLPSIASSTEEPAAVVSDGKTSTPTGRGTFIVPPPGSPMRLVQEDPARVTIAADAHPWGPADLTETANTQHEPARPSEGSADTCTNYRAGWYVTDASSLWGGHMGVIPRSLPPDTTYYCTGKGMGYTDGVAFGSNRWIQAGLAIFPGESSAKWFCQSNDSGTFDTRYGSANAYGNGTMVYTWFARDSGGTWRTYRYDTGPWAVELGCTISAGASGHLQVLGEIQGATSTSAPMGPWDMLDLRYLYTDNTWYVPTQVQAQYPGSTPCPPYGAGTVSSGYLYAGSGKACTTGTSAYPN